MGVSSESSSFSSSRSRTESRAWALMESPVGALRIVVRPEGVVAIQFSPFAEDADVGVRDDEAPLLVEAVRQLRAYFDGELTEFDLPLAPDGTDYQRRVWDALGQVPYGQTATYAEIAASLGQPPGASRAVGLANGRNPIPVVVPCHRVIGTDGSLTGYAGGLDRKRALLDLERATDDQLF